MKGQKKMWRQTNKKKIAVSFLSLIILINLIGCGTLQERSEDNLIQVLEDTFRKDSEKAALDERALANGIVYHRIGMVKEAVESGKGVDINCFTEPRKWESVRYYTPIAYAMACGGTDIFNYLLEQGASLEGLTDKNRNAGTILGNYRFRYQEEYLEILLEHDYDFNLRTEDGRNSLDALFREERRFDGKLWEVAQILIENGAEITSKTVESIINSGDRGNENLPKIVRYLAERGEDTGLEEIYEKAILSESETVQELLPKIKGEEKIEELGYLIAAYCDVETLMQIMEENSSVDWHQTTIIRAACRAGNMENLKYLIEEKHFVEDTENSISVTAMEQAESNRHYDIVEYLMGKGYEPPCEATLFGGHGWGSLLVIDVINGDRERLEYCLKNNMGIPDKFERVIEATLQIKDYETYQYLYTYAKENGIEVNEEELLQSCNEDPEMMRYTIEQSDITAEELNKTLKYIVDYCDLECVQILLEAGANPNYDDVPFQAVYTDDIDKVKILVEYGMDVNYVTEESHFGLLSLSAQYSNEVMNYLLDQGIDFSKGSGNERALIAAVNTGRVRNAEDLIAAGIDLEVTNKDGMTAYDMAKIGGYEEILAVFE